NREESLRLAVACQGGRRVSESTIARARASTVPPNESRGPDTAAMIAPVRVSARRIYNHVRAPGSGSRWVNQKRYAVGAPPPFTALRTEYPRRFSPRPISRLSESWCVTRMSYARTDPGARYPMAGAQEARKALPNTAMPSCRKRRRRTRQRFTGNASPGNSWYDAPRPHPAIQPVRPLRVTDVEPGQLHAARRAVDELPFSDVHPDVRHSRARPGGAEKDIARSQRVHDMSRLRSG